MSEEKTVNKRFFERSPTNASETSRDLRRRWLAPREWSGRGGPRLGVPRRELAELWGFAASGGRSSKAFN